LAQRDFKAVRVLLVLKDLKDLKARQVLKELWVLKE
jgi:hypothetical protein